MGTETVHEGVIVGVTATLVTVVGDQQYLSQLVTATHVKVGDQQYLSLLMTATLVTVDDQQYLSPLVASNTCHCW